MRVLGQQPHKGNSPSSPNLCWCGVSAVYLYCCREVVDQVQGMLCCVIMSLAVGTQLYMQQMVIVYCAQINCLRSVPTGSVVALCPSCQPTQIDLHRGRPEPVQLV